MSFTMKKRKFRLIPLTQYGAEERYVILEEAKDNPNAFITLKICVKNKEMGKVVRITFDEKTTDEIMLYVQGLKAKRLAEKL